MKSHGSDLDSCLLRSQKRRKIHKKLQFTAVIPLKIYEEEFSVTRVLSHGIKHIGRDLMEI